MAPKPVTTSATSIQAFETGSTAVPETTNEITVRTLRYPNSGRRITISAAARAASATSEVSIQASRFGIAVKTAKATPPKGMIANPVQTKAIPAGRSRAIVRTNTSPEPKNNPTRPHTPASLTLLDDGPASSAAAAPISNKLDRYSRLFRLRFATRWRCCASWAGVSGGGTGRAGGTRPAGAATSGRVGIACGGEPADCRLSRRPAA